MDYDSWLTNNPDDDPCSRGQHEWQVIGKEKEGEEIKRCMDCGTWYSDYLKNLDYDGQ